MNSIDNSSEKYKPTHSIYTYYIHFELTNHKKFVYERVTIVYFYLRRTTKEAGI